VSESGPAPVERDSRGILDPWLLRQRVQLNRYPPGPVLDGLVDRFWAVRWNLPPGQHHRQQVLTYPGTNISVGHANARPGDREAGRVQARLNGVAKRLSERVLVGQGWAAAAMTTPGGLGAFITGPASQFTGRVVPLGQAISLDEAGLLRRITAEPGEKARVGLLAGALERVLERVAGQPAGGERIRAAREVTAAARLAETDRSVRRVTDLSQATGVGVRTLQRMFLQHAGVSPAWVIRRYRLLEAAEAVRDGATVSWAQVAADLGYSDQAHLTRDFRVAFGRTPAAYAQAQPSRSTPPSQSTGPSRPTTGAGRQPG
jgi:AraC-like DNA-binding protein